MENENMKGNELVNITQEDKKEKKEKKGIRSLISRIIKFAGRLIKKGNVNYFNIVKKGKDPMRINLTVTVLLFLIAFWAVFFIMVAGLFFGYRYYLDGPDFEKKNVNDYFDKAADTADSVKKDFQDGYKNA